jgi:hypothetical protein
MNFPRKVVYTPISFGGLGFKQHYVESSCSKIESIMCQINSKTTLGRCMETILNWTQLHSGISLPILTSDCNLDYITNNWFMQVREFLLTTNSKIIVNTAWLPRTKRVNDFNLMERVIQLDILYHNATKNI